MTRITKGSNEFEILENANSNGYKPGLRNSNEIIANFMSYTAIKSNKIYNLLFTTSESYPINFNVPPNTLIRIYQSGSDSTEDVYAKVLKVISSSPWVIQILIESGDITKTKVSDEIVFNLEMKIGVKSKYETVSKIFATSVKQTTAIIKWTNPNSNQIIGYSIQHRKLNDTINTNWIRTNFGLTDEKKLTNLETKTRYEIQVMISYRNGYSRFSDSYYFKTI